VGDRFKSFAKHHNVITLSQLYELMKGISNAAPEHQTFMYSVYLGQGISDKQYHKLQQMISNYDLADTVSLLGQRQQLTRASMSATHKHHEQNVMISEPEKIDEKSFTAHLMLDEHAALMRDHLTGEHVQGMVVMEAMRQMATATTELYLLPQERTTDFQFVFNAVETSFHQFVFPLDAQIDLKIKRCRQTPDGNCRASVAVTVQQGGHCMLAVEMTFTAMKKEFVDHKESSMARTMLADVIHIGRSLMNPQPALHVA
jgi:hypothetical protein